MRDDFDLGHRSLEFEETAAHVIPSGDEPQAVKALLPHPLSRLAGIAEGVGCPVAEHDATVGPVVRSLRTIPRAAQKILQIDLLIDAGDEELAPFSLTQQRDAAIQPLTTARQHDDGVGGLRAILG